MENPSVFSTSLAEFLDGWRLGVEARTVSADGDRARGVVLAGLPWIVRGQAGGEGLGPAGPTEAIEMILDIEGSAKWRATTRDGRSRPFLVDLAARLLTLGWIGDPAYPDLGIHVFPGLIDADCDDETLATARALTAVEIEDPALMRQVAARRVVRIANGDAAGRSEAIWRWLDPMISDEPAQELIVVGIVEALPGESWQTAALIRTLARLDPAVFLWPSGPIAAVVALARLLSEPDSVEFQAALIEATRRWKGWSEEAYWTIRNPEPDLDQLRFRLVGRVVEAVRLDRGKLWRVDRIERDLIAAWPQLRGFCRAPGVVATRG